ncbi:tRNA uracil-5-methyltransferase-like protein [Dinothrombium tinctorium]|uniref:tRNA (uracil(54)-C(5))-methyltransferase n=1 Tax=Dinothrombium tinctorium TaxID=1965070 RepID=A0A3S3PKE8_9ACAR|nr:tRNA uracil-5-methyltransferase-like protein [Dinothrombium tinctorium]RWS13316.1 tRNA uracil-5-methyltransferase-like protein [Dinothrombium tinctorium]RWS14309.1 tRNA uracil-5-methyltransferase-like protein [Dinothrombium tinctorium]RWS14320.1 tRNA uracil-5-methyltransferase-like protein [Dinothrombium tinctorium]
MNAANAKTALNAAISPLVNYSYSKQLQFKWEHAFDVFDRLAFRLRQVCGHGSFRCKVDKTLSSPLTVAYRNKDEFSIWPSISGERKTVGFCVGRPSRGERVVCVEPDDELIITKNSHKKLAKLFQTYLRTLSPLDICTDLTDGGNWRRFIVRSNRKGEHMLITVMHPQKLKTNDIDDEKQRLKTYFNSLAEENSILSLFFQACPGVRCTHETAPFQLLFGQKTLKETLNGITFEISPETFFQVNTDAAEVLYKVVIDELKLSPNHIVIDLCCGIGALSLQIAPYVQRVIGIDRSKSAIEDAKRNAELNHIKNCVFIDGLVENVFHRLYDDLSNRRIVVIANPSRDGLTTSVIKAIRDLPFIERVVYISCKPEGNASQNFFHLVLPERIRRDIRGIPFYLDNAIPVDLFPHTPHYELVVTFERFES